MGIAVYRSSPSSLTKGNFIAKNCEVKNISGIGTAKGLTFSFNNSSKSSILIDSSVIDTIAPATDEDAIHITTANYSSDLTHDNTFGALIINSNIKSSTAMKRGKEGAARAVCCMDPLSSATCRTDSMFPRLE